ncbi:hypothetical protein GGX14DRAFT_325343, partial [Mycena pura]
QETIGVVIVIVPEAGCPHVGLSQLQDLLKECLHPSKWPFAIVYMDNIPKNSAGKPLRIKLADRLGIGRLSNAIPMLMRHLEVAAPSSHWQAALIELILCMRVQLDLEAIERVLRAVYGVEDAALRVRAHRDGAPEAFVCADGLNAGDVDATLRQVLPGYA